MGFEVPSPVQSEVIPKVLEGIDLLAQAPTGTGKTCAFGIPLIDMIDPKNSAVQCIIMCPTRELAKQIEEELRRVLKYLESVKVMSIYGGANFQRQLATLKKRPQIVVGTPGRIIDHIERRTLKLLGVNMVVLDEADEMLNMGFRPDMDRILQEIPATAQKVMFSATMPKEILEISRSYQNAPITIKTQVNEKDMPQIKQNYVKLKEGSKMDAFHTIMQQNGYRTVIVFCNTKRRCDEVERRLRDMGYKSNALHGDLRQSKRDFVMKGFRQKEFDVLVATDVAARGIDVNDVEAIFNYDLPSDDEYYIHRVGRTARANKDGIAYSFASAKDIHRVSEIEKYIKTSMTEIELNGISAINLATKKTKVVTANTKRLFCNVGTRDGADEKSLLKFVLDFAKLKPSEVLEVKVLEGYSFLEIANEMAGAVLMLTGMNFNMRKVVIEEAGKAKGVTNKSRGSRDGSRSSDERSTRSRGRGDRNDRNDRNTSDRPSRTRRNDFEDRNERSERPSRDRKPSGFDRSEKRDSNFNKFRDNKKATAGVDGERSGGFERKSRNDRAANDSHSLDNRFAKWYDYGEEESSRDRKPRGERSFNRDDRKPREFKGEKSFNRDDRKPREFKGEKSFNRDDRKPREFKGEKSFNRDDRKPREFKGEKSFNRDDRKPREFKGEKSFNRDDRKPREFKGEKSFNRDDRKPREFKGEGFKSADRKPSSKSYDKMPAKFARERKSVGDKSFGSNRPTRRK